MDGKLVGYGTQRYEGGAAIIEFDKPVTVRTGEILKVPMSFEVNQMFDASNLSPGNWIGFDVYTNPGGSRVRACQLNFLGGFKYLRPGASSSWIGKQGDYFIVAADGEKWICSQEEFAERYTLGTKAPVGSLKERSVEKIRFDQDDNVEVTIHETYVFPQAEFADALLLGKLKEKSNVG